MDRRFFKARLPEKLLSFGIKEQLTFLKGSPDSKQTLQE